MKTNNKIYLNLEIASIIIGVVVIIASFVPGLLEITWEVIKFPFDVANFFLWGFFIGATIMVGGALIFDHLDDIFNDK